MTPEMFRKLAALGLSHEQMAGVLEIFEAEAETRKEKARTRVQRWRDKRRDETQRNVTEHNETQRAGSHEGVTRGLDNLQKQKISGQEEKKDTSPAARSKRGARIPDDFQPDIEAAVSEGVSRPEAERQARSFCDYWRAKPGKEGLKLDWQATWRVWFRRNLSSPAPSRQATSPPPKQTVGQQARDELRRRGMIDAPDNQTRYRDESDGSPGFAGTGIARRIAIAASGRGGH